MKQVKALLINFSHQSKGSTYNALKIMETEFKNNHIETQSIEFGGLNIEHCRVCNRCRKSKCEINDDFYYMLSEIEHAEILVLASPIYVGSITSLGMTFIQRLTYYLKNNGNILENKIGSPVIVAGESGHLTGYNQLVNFYIVNGMMVVGSDYWPVYTSSYANKIRDNSSDDNLIKLANNIIHMVKRR